MSLDDLPLDIVLNEAATTYETLAALPPTASPIGARRPGKPGSKVPPGVNEILDAEEYETTITAVDDWAEYLAHHLLDIEPGIGRAPDHTPGRLRLAARWTDKLEQEPDLLARYAFKFDAVEHLKMLRRLVRRNNRVVRTGSACLNITCKGQYEAVIDGPDIDGDLVCSHCKDRVPAEQWSRWGAQSEWVTVARAARILGISETAVRQRASRGNWARKGEGREVRYRTADVNAAADDTLKVG